MEYYTGVIGKWYCRSCGMQWYSFDDECLFCKKKKERVDVPARWQYREIESIPSSRRGYCESDIYF